MEVSLLDGIERQASAIGDDRRGARTVLAEEAVLIDPVAGVHAATDVRCAHIPHSHPRGRLACTCAAAWVAAALCILGQMKDGLPGWARSVGVLSDVVAAHQEPRGADAFVRERLQSGVTRRQRWTRR